MTLIEQQAPDLDDALKPWTPYGERRWPVSPEAKWDRVLSLIDASGDCWEWLGSHDVRGYGRIFAEGRHRYAHLYIYERLVGPVPDGLEIDHLCRNHDCVNPDHLEPVTHRENILRGQSIGARHSRRTHCSHGHLLDGRKRDGSRYCLTCNRERVRRYRHD